MFQWPSLPRNSWGHSSKWVDLWNKTVRYMWRYNPFDQLVIHDFNLKLDMCCIDALKNPRSDTSSRTSSPNLCTFHIIQRIYSGNTYFARISLPDFLQSNRPNNPNTTLNVMFILLNDRTRIKCGFTALLLIEGLLLLFPITSSTILR